MLNRDTDLSTVTEQSNQQPQTVSIREQVRFPHLSRRQLLRGVLAGAALLAMPKRDVMAAPEKTVRKEVLGIDVVGPQSLIDASSRSLALLRETDCWESDIVLLERIESNTYSGVDITGPEITFLVNPATWNYSDIWFAGAIAHDAHHAKLYTDAVKQYGVEGVEDKMWKGTEGETLALKFQIEVLKQLKAEQYIIDFLQQLIDAGPVYQDIPLDQRNW